MGNKIIPSFSLPTRITAIFFCVAVASTVTYLVIMVIMIGKLEETMMATLVGHELDELVTSLAEDPDTKMPRTASVNAYLRSRDSVDPLPSYLRDLRPDLYKEIRFEDNSYQVMVLDLGDDRIYVSFAMNEIAKNQDRLLLLIVGGGLLTTLVLVVFGIWLFRKFLLPVSKLADEVSSIDPNDRTFRVGDKYQGYEVGKIAQAIDQTLNRFDEYIEREQSFTSAASHELRTPLAVISTSAELLEMKGVSGEQRPVVDRIKEASRYMGGVIESLLFFARNSQDVAEKTLPEVETHEVVSRVLKKHEESAAAKNLALRYKCEGKLKVRMSESHVEIILGNLIRNAISNTDSGEVRVTLMDNGFSVKDTGKGIGSDKIEMIVTRNYRMPDSGGSGIGLYLVNKICEMYGLKLNINSVVGAGSEFSVVFSDDKIY